MTYRELVKKVQDYSGFSDSESETALQIFVKKLAGRLSPDERKDFASQLPSDLQDTAMTDETCNMKTLGDFIKQLCEEENIDEGKAKKQIFSAWRAIKDQISSGEIDDIKSQLPNDLAAQLY